MSLPNWVKKHRAPKTEIKAIGNHYYVYEVSSVWDAKLRRAKKVSGKLLGKITKEQGFIARPARIAIDQKTRLCVKEFGVSHLIESKMKEYADALKEHFQGEWQQILVTAYSRLLYQSPLKNISLHYDHSFLSEIYTDVSVSGKSISEMLHSVGSQRDKIVKFFKMFQGKGGYILVDGTSFTSNSDAPLVELGYDPSKAFNPQAKLLFAYAQQQRAPVYYRLIPGNINDVKSFKLCLKESNLSDVTVITDKGFYSKSNVAELQENNLRFIIPLPRNSTLIDYARFKTIDKSKFDGYFTFNNRIIWFKSNKNVTIYLNEELKLTEQNNYLKRIETHPEEYSIKEFHNKEHSFGTLALLSNLDHVTPQKIFSQYKSRAAIEQLFDSFKNLLEADRSYMRDNQGLEGWMFINYIALCWYYKLYSLLLNANLLAKFSVADLLMRLSKITKIKLQDSWVFSEITSKSEKLLRNLDIHIT